MNFSHLSYGPKSLLMISYIYYDSGKHLESLQNIQKFKKFYPNHQNYDYAEYLVGLNFYDRINDASRDQRNTKLALRQFEKIIKKYPKTDYAFDAKYKIDLIRIHFPDPWPKKRHAKRRLITKKFLEISCNILKDNGSLEIITDSYSYQQHIEELIKI